MTDQEWSREAVRKLLQQALRLCEIELEAMRRAIP